LLADSRQTRGDIAYEPYFLGFTHQSIELSGLHEIIVVAMQLRRVISR
jgi:hypothetical protein